MSALEHLECAWLNPFDSDAARSHSSYHGWHDGDLVRLLETAPASPFARVANDAFRSFVLDDAFSCLGAKSAIRRGTYRLGVYESLDDPAGSEGLTFAVGEGICGHAAATRKSVYVSDLESDSVLFKVRGGPGAQGRGSLLALPMLHGEELLGVLNFERPHKAAFSASETSIFIRPFRKVTGLRIPRTTSASVTVGSRPPFP